MDPKSNTLPADNTSDDAPVMLVTGSAKRIGAAIIKAAHKQGHRVIIHCYHSQNEADNLARQLNNSRLASAWLKNKGALALVKNSSSHCA